VDDDEETILRASNSCDLELIQVHLLVSSTLALNDGGPRLRSS
jgi:hypothetical protein